MSAHLFLELDQPRGQLRRRKSQLHHMPLLHGKYLLLGHSRKDLAIERVANCPSTFEPVRTESAGDF